MQHGVILFVQLQYQGGLIKTLSLQPLCHRRLNLLTAIFNTARLDTRQSSQMDFYVLFDITFDALDVVAQHLSRRVRRPQQSQQQSSDAAKTPNAAGENEREDG